MASVKVSRKDANGHIISKKDKKYHISFNDIIDIIKVPSYKKFNKINEDGEETLDEEPEIFPLNENIFIDNSQKPNIEDCPSRDPKTISKGCYII